MGTAVSDGQNAQSVEQRLAAMEAKDEIRELTARYCHAVVDGDAETIVGLFCDDGAFRTKKFEYRGDAELRGMYEGGVGAKSHKPFIQNHVIELTSATEATGRCSVEIRIFENDEAITAAGHYLDAYRKQDGRWLFADRFFQPYHFAPVTTGWTK